jgi:pre-mRNA-splicing factor SYF1
MRLLRFERLMDRRPFLVNDVLLRQNPNNVMEWEKRVLLWKDDKKKVRFSYISAVAKLVRRSNPLNAVGR